MMAAVFDDFITTVSISWIVKYKPAARLSLHKANPYRPLNNPEIPGLVHTPSYLHIDSRVISFLGLNPSSDSSDVVSGENALGEKSYYWKG